MLEKNLYTTGKLKVLYKGLRLVWLQNRMMPFLSLLMIVVGLKRIYNAF